jgi:alpha-glucosidase
MKQYIGPERPLHTAYNFSLFTQGFNGDQLAQVLRDFEHRVPTGTPTWALGNHDVVRYITRFRTEDQWQRSAKCFLTFLFCLRGHLSLFQGDELALEEATIPYAKMQDPFGLAFYPEFPGRDGCRTPLPWVRQRAGIEPWLPIPDSHLEKCIEVQQLDPNSVLRFTKKLIAWRKANPWLVSAPLQVLSSTPSTLVLQRALPQGDPFVLAINGSSEIQKISAPESVSLPPLSFRCWNASGTGFPLESEGL